MELIPTLTSWRVSILVVVLIQFCGLLCRGCHLQNRKLWLWIKKEFGFSSKSQYRTWQKKLAEDSTWPPTHRTDYSGDGENGFCLNLGYEDTERIPRARLKWRGQTTEQHFWTRL
uniref:ATPase 13A5 n=1 Tax=Ailuropoda melanoleuca TaxID=9646 RepID=A0A7N5KDG9_AILME